VTLRVPPYSLLLYMNSLRIRCQLYLYNIRITIAEIKGRDKSPFFRRIIHFFTFLYSVGVKEYILLNVLQK